MSPSHNNSDLVEFKFSHLTSQQRLVKSPSPKKESNNRYTIQNGTDKLHPDEMNEEAEMQAFPSCDELMDKEQPLFKSQ